MIFDKNGIPHIECESCFNNNSICQCCIYSGNTKYPNMYNTKFESENKKFIKSENIFEGKIL